MRAMWQILVERYNTMAEAEESWVREAERKMQQRLFNKLHDSILVIIIITL